jgi:hypothetical protein
VLTRSGTDDYDSTNFFFEARRIPMNPRAHNWMFCLITLAAASLLACANLAAHHSFVIFDQTKEVTLTGSVTEFQWTNPHAYIEIDVTDDKGVVKHWSVELGSPSILLQSGWKYRDLKHGDKVTVRLNPLRDGQAGGLLIQVTLPDGRVLGNGPGRGPATPARGQSK